MQQYFTNLDDASPAGKAWVIKSLDPASDQPQFQGLPGGSQIPLVLSTFCNTQILTPPINITSAQTWTSDILFAPSLLSQYTYANITNDGALTSTGTIFNTEIAGDPNTLGLSNVVRALGNLIVDMRPVYIGATVELICNALSDQGSVNAAQYTVPHSEFIIPATATSAYVPIWVFDSDQVATFSKLATMPAVYSDVAKKGCYMPLKLAKDSRKFVKSTETVLYSNQTNVYVDQYCHALTSFSLSGHFPYDAGNTDFAAGVPTWGTASAKLNGLNFGHVAFQGLSYQSSLKITYRAGWEFHVLPSTSLVPFLKQPPLEDRIACEAHDRIMSELKDAYPASYNASGMLGKIVGGIGKALQLFSPIASFINPIAGGIMSATGNIATRLTEPKAVQVKEAMQPSAKVITENIPVRVASVMPDIRRRRSQSNKLNNNNNNNNKSNIRKKRMAWVQLNQ